MAEEIEQETPELPPPPLSDWYDGYEHQLPPAPPFPPEPYHPPFPPPPSPRKICPECRSKNVEKYGFEPIVGERYYTATKSACCPVKVTVTKITATDIYYVDKDGTPNSKTFHEFMTSSWKDRSLQ